MLIATRCACLTGDINHIIFGDNHEYLSNAKGRIDIILDIKKHNKFRLPTKSEIENHITWEEYLGLYWQQAECSHFKTNRIPQYFIIDQYSELTDKRFEHKNGYAFAGHYGNIRAEDFNNGLTDYGLIDTTTLQDKYDEYFDFMKYKWPNTKFIFTNFPIEKEIREEYIKQWSAIASAIDNICGKYNIQNIHADKDQIEFTPDSDAYHFTIKTAQNMASKIKL